MIRVVSETQLAELLQPAQEYGYYVISEDTDVEILDGPFIDKARATHVATTVHGMKADADEDDGQDDLPW